MRKVRIPNAVPYLFTALKIAAPLAVITAFVSEYFGGPQNGLGSRIVGEHRDLEERDGWAYVAGRVPARPGVLPASRSSLERVADAVAGRGSRSRDGSIMTMRPCAITGRRGRSGKGKPHEEQATACGRRRT